jgi:hypothetical protein
MVNHEAIANAVIERRIKSAVANRVAARGGTKADETKVLKAIAKKLA